MLICAAYLCFDWTDSLPAIIKQEAEVRGHSLLILAPWTNPDSERLSTGSGLFVRKMLASGIAAGAGADLILKILVSVGSSHVHGPAHGPEVRSYEANIWLNMFVF